MGLMNILVEMEGEAGLESLAIEVDVEVMEVDL